MYAEEPSKQLHDWAEQSLLLLRELLPLMSAVGIHEKWTTDERQTLGFLLSACARSSESALLLTACGQLWDAEVLVRSVAEGSLKFCYLLQNHETFKKRYQEYSHDLFRIALLKDHRKAAELLTVLRDRDDPRWAPIRDLLLSNEEWGHIDRDYGPAQRRALETRWGFTGLMGELVRSGDVVFPGFAYGYSLASHIQHVDYVGASIPLERDRRSADRRDSIHLAHGVRLLSDAFAFFYLRLSTGYRFIDHDLTPIIVAWEKVKELLAGFGAVFEAWKSIEYPENPVPSEG
jgi:hypothetical protein